MNHELNGTMRKQSTDQNVGCSSSQPAWMLQKISGMEFPLWLSGNKFIRMRVRSLTSLGGLRIRHCHELWCRSQTQLGSGIVMVVG